MTRKGDLLLACLASMPFLFWIISKHIGLDLWYDEVYTLKRFVFVPLRETVTTYNLPNNHVFANLANNIYLKFIGLESFAGLADSPVVLRSFMLFFSLLTLFFVYTAARICCGREAAVLSAVLLGSTVPFLNFAVQIRGYALSMTAVSLLVCLLWLSEDELTWARGLGITLAGAIAVYAIPLNLYALGSMGFFYFVKGAWKNIREVFRIRPKRRGWTRYLFHGREMTLVLLLVLGAVLAFILYRPVLQQVLHNKYVRSHEPFNAQVLTEIMPAVLRYFISGRWLLVAIAAVGLVGAAWKALKKDEKIVFSRYLFCITVLFTPFLMSWARGDRPFLRVFVNLIPVFSLLLAMSISASTALLPWWSRSRASLSIMAAVLCLYSIFVADTAIAKRDAVLLDDIRESRSSQNIYYNWYQAHYRPSSIAERIREHDPAGRVRVVLGEVYDKYAMPAYLEHSGIVFTSWGGTVLSEDERFFAVTAHPFDFIGKMRAGHPDLRCELLPGALHYHNVLDCRSGGKAMEVGSP